MTDISTLYHRLHGLDISGPLNDKNSIKKVTTRKTFGGELHPDVVGHRNRSYEAENRLKSVNEKPIILTNNYLSYFLLNTLDMSLPPPPLTCMSFSLVRFMPTQCHVLHVPWLRFNERERRQS